MLCDWLEPNGKTTDRQGLPLQPIGPTGGLRCALRHTRSWPPSVHECRLDFIRVAAAGAGTVIALAVTAWPNGAAGALIGFIGALIGLSLWFGVEFVSGLRVEVERLQNVERELQAERDQRAKERKLRDYQLAVARAEAGINAVDVDVYGGALRETAATGQVLPLAAILARRDALMKARGLDRPVPPLQP